MKIILGADHAGFNIKEKIKKYLKRRKILFKDLSPKLIEKDDYPDHAKKVAKEVLKNKDNKGILVCGTGTGMVIAANRFKGIRAIAAHDSYSAKMSRIDNDTNVLGLRGRFISFLSTKDIINTWLKTPFSKKPRHKRRIKKLG